MKTSKPKTPPQCGERVTTLSRLIELSMQRKSVTCPKTYCFRGPMPAAFVSNLQGTIINRLLNSGLFVYIPGKTTKKFGAHDRP